MKCDLCEQQPAVIHVTELREDPEAPPGPAGTIVEEQHLCQSCAKGIDLPYVAVESPMVDIWKLLQSGAAKSDPGAVACPDCGWTLADVRSKGRLGCPRDYEVFSGHIEDLLERIHGATEHRGRRPGQAEPEPDPHAELNGLREQLADAILAEEYERAAELRDRLHALERDAGQKA
ncbi:MAG: hypothetical protein GC161_18550 [Planctomycetaceae bacterium]|nr:hypothetical protein [Planctomycetaceae bacterium]